MSSRPSPRWSPMPSAISRASTIMPAHVARVGRPPLIAFRRGARTCSAKAPCIARTPMRGNLLRLGAELPASGSEQLVLRDGRDLEAAHGLSKTGRYLGDDLRPVVVRRRGDDRLGTLQGVLGLEDARTDEDAVDAELHHQRGVGRSGDAAGSKVHDRETS